MRAILAVLAMAVVGCASPGDPSITDGSASPKRPQTTAVESTTESSKANQDLLGPTGYIGLELGTSMEDARAAGLLLDDGRQAPVELSLISDRDGPCRGFLFGMYGDAMGYRAHGYFSEDGGLAVIYGQGNMKTPEGVGYGTSLADLQQTFPALSAESADLYRTVTSSETEYLFRLDQKERVRYFAVALTDDPCSTVGLPTDPTGPPQPK